MQFLWLCQERAPALHTIVNRKLPRSVTLKDAYARILIERSTLTEWTRRDSKIGGRRTEHHDARIPHR